MTIDDELEARILRYHFAEHWRVNTIARQLGVHHSTVSRVLAQAGVPKAKRARSPSILDDYTPLIIETLAQYPTLTATRLYHMAVERGYRGSCGHFRAHVQQLRPRPPAEAYLRLKTLPGEQAQVDWGHFHYLTIGRAKRPLMAFVIVLSWSRAIFVRFYLNQQLNNFLRGHVEAFERFGGVPRVLLYDNLKSAVLERQGNAIRFNPTLLSLSGHYRFEPRPVAVARGNQKGRVERAIRFIRDSFFAGRRFTDLADLNAQADQWCAEVAGQRSCPEDPTLTVNAAAQQEREQLLSLPDNPFPCDERIAVRIGKTPYARFDLNDYSVPPQFVRRTLTVLANLTQVRLLDGDTPVASHVRSYDRHAQIENPAHIEQLLAFKQAGRHHRGHDRLATAVPASIALLELAASHHLPLGPLVARLLSLLERYGPQELQIAIIEANEQQRPHADAVLQILERRREQRQQPPPVPVTLSAELRQLSVRPASLHNYDTVNPLSEHDHEHDDTTTGSDAAGRDQ